MSWKVRKDDSWRVWALASKLNAARKTTGEAEQPALIGQSHLPLAISPRVRHFSAFYCSFPSLATKKGKKEIINCANRKHTVRDFSVTAFVVSTAAPHPNALYPGLKQITPYGVQAFFSSLHTISNCRCSLTARTGGTDLEEWPVCAALSRRVRYVESRVIVKIKTLYDICMDFSFQLNFAFGFCFTIS